MYILFLVSECFQHFPTSLFGTTNPISLGSTGRDGSPWRARVLRPFLPVLCREPREVLGGADEGSGGFQDWWKATISDRGDIQKRKSGVTLSQKHDGIGIMLL